MSRTSNAVVSREQPTRVALIVDDEDHILDSVQTSLAKIGWESVCVGTVTEALHASRDPILTLALIDYRLGTGDDGLRLGRALRRRRGLPFILFSGYLTTAVTVSAVRAGASDVIEKPLSEDCLYDALEAVLLRDTSHHVGLSAFVESDADPDDERRPASVRWSRLVLRTCLAAKDPYKLALWTRDLRVSESWLRQTCDTCEVGVLESRNLARILRAVYRTLRTGKRLGDHFAILDDRTLRALFERAGLSPLARVVNLPEFFRNQTFIPRTRPCLHELSHLAANSPLFFYASQ